MKFKNKEELIKKFESDWEKLWKLLDTFTDEDMVQAPKKRTGSMEKSGDAWSPKDILAHLHEWHNMPLRWYKEGLSGTPEMPAKGYNWRQIPELNREIYKKYKDISLPEAKKLVKASHEKFLKLMKSLSEKELLEPGCFEWTKKLSLSSYLGIGHYKWAYITIKQY